MGLGSHHGACRFWSPHPPSFMKIYLYTAVSSSSQFVRSPLFATASLRARRHFIHLRDLLVWQVFGRFQFAHYNYSESFHSNIGDVAIRLAIIQELTRALAPRPVEFIELAWGSLDDDVIDRINQDGALFVIGGSGYYHHDAQGRLNHQPRADVAFLRRLRCPIAAVGIGINCGTFDAMDDVSAFDEPSRQALRDSLACLTFCSVRDERTRRLLQDLSPRPILLVGDSALFLDFNPHLPPPATLRVGVNFSFHGPLAQSLLGRNLATYLADLRQFRARTGCQYVYFQHSSGESLIARLLNRGGVPVEVVSGGPEHMLTEYTGLSMHCSQMLHSAILSANAGTPCLNLAYDLKNRAFYDLFGLQRFSLNPYRLEPGQLLEALLRLQAERDEVRQALTVRRAELQSVYRQSLAGLAASL